jgi:gamma-glutamyltranspeptidase / glutathione hydrolase
MIHQRRRRRGVRWTRGKCSGRVLSRGSVLLCGALCAAQVAVAGDDGGTRYAGRAFASRSPVLARHGMAATSHPLASAVAVDVLKRGGSAVDAAIAANAMLALVEPHACGMGGDLFAIVWDPKTRRLYGYNGSGRSPRGQDYAALVRALGGATQLPIYGPLTVTVPGAVDGWYALHERFGALPMSALLEPAIRYAREGIAVTEIDAWAWADGLAEVDAAGLPAAALENLHHTYQVEGAAPRAGSIFRNADLAASYEALAAGGRDSFYRGALAQRIVRYLARSGSQLTAEDFAAHRGEWVDPVSVRYRGYDVHELPPNGQGIAVLQMLNILEGFDLARMGRDSADFWHVLIEAKKLAYEDRARFYADPAFSKPPLAWLLSKEYAAERRAMLKMDRAALTLPAGQPPQHGDTTYLATADASGMMVSFIQSTYYEFGSGLVPDGMGFALQNRGSSFSLEPQHRNVYAPGKRPFHTIIPGFVTKDGEPVLAFGVMGGAVQPQGQVQVLVNWIDFGMNIQEAGDAARFVHSGSSEPTGTLMRDGGSVELEAGVPASVARELRARGHRVERGGHPYVGGYQAVQRDPETGVYHGASEMRFDGSAIGY